MSPTVAAKYRTPLYSWHARHAGRLQEVNGWALPAAYGDVEGEIAAARSAAGLVDASAYATFSVQGRGAAQGLAALTGVDRPRMVANWGTEGALVCRLTDEHLVVLTPRPGADAIRQRLQEFAGPLNLLVQDAGAAQAHLILLGPHSEAVLRQLTALDISEAALPSGTCAETSLAGIHALLIRAPAGPLPAFQIRIAWDLAEYVWERLLEAGHAAGLVAVGLDAYGRIEARP